MRLTNISNKINSLGIKIKVSLLILFFLFVFINPGVCRMWETPISFIIACEKLNNVDIQPVDPGDISSLINEDKIREADLENPLPYRFAKSITTDFSSENKDHGTWETLPDKSRLWRIRILSVGAKSINLGITKFSLPEGAKLWIYSYDREYVEGPYLDKHKTNGQLWTPIIPGDQIVIELYVPFGAIREPVVVIGKVNYGYRGIEMENKVFQSPRGPCNIDVACLEDDSWQDQIRSVAFYSLNGVDKCSGVLVNNTRRDFIPYFLTACHCGVNCDNAHTIVVYWKYQSQECHNCSNHGRGGSLKYSQVGAFSRARWRRKVGSDFALVELKEKPHPSYNVHYSGWDASEKKLKPASGVVGIHHPRCSLKAISFGSIYNGEEQEEESRENYWTVKWEKGTVQQGSSGSGLWDQSSGLGLCIGQLRGPAVDCDKKNRCKPGDSTCEYGKLSAGWEGGGTPDTQLKYWLDPCDTFKDPGKRILYGADPTMVEEISLKQVAVGNQVAIWAVSKDDQIYRWNNFKWERLPCCQKITQISAGFDGTVWGVNKKEQVYRWTGKCWESMPGSLKQVSVACKGTIWGVDNNNRVYRWAGNNWKLIQNCLMKHVDVGDDRTVWGVDKNDQARMWLWRGNRFDTYIYLKKVKHISAAEESSVWCVDKTGMVFKFDGASFIQIKPRLKLKQISVGHAGIALGMDEHGKVYRWNNKEKKWENFK
jgi:hypothetical protein